MNRMSDLISRQDAIDLVRDVCDAILSECGCHYDSEVEGEVYDDIHEVSTILKCNKAIRKSLMDLPSAQPYTEAEIQKMQELEQAEIQKAYELGKAEANRWIPCSERLPDITEHHTSDPCIVFCDNGAYGFAELEENIFGQVGWNCERDDEYHEPLGTVVAWMPLPEAYEEEV